MKPNAKLKYKFSLAAWVYTKQSPRRVCSQGTLRLIKLILQTKFSCVFSFDKRLSAHSLDLYFGLKLSHEEILLRITVSPASPQGSLELDTVVGRSVDKGTASLSRVDPVLWRLQMRL